MNIRAKTRALGQKIGNVEKKVIKAVLPDSLVSKAKTGLKKIVSDRVQAQKNWSGRMNNSNYYGKTEDFK